MELKDKRKGFLRKNRPRLVKIVFVNLVLLLIFLEAGSLLFYFIKTHGLFYTIRIAHPAALAGVHIDEARFAETVIERLHPFFGFTLKPGDLYGASRTERHANNYGFISAQDYPVTESDDNQVLVGVFGGSVALTYAVYELDNGILAERLKRNPYFSNKKIVILPFCYGGYKQPQQLLLLNYFLALGQHLDLVINIDGFNEVALSNLNRQAGLALPMPSIQHMRPLINLASGNESTEELTSLLEIGQYNSAIKVTLEALDHCTLASTFTLRLLYLRYLTSRYRKQDASYDRFWARKFRDLDSNSLVVVNQDAAISNRSDDAAFEEMALLWANGSKMMSRELAERKVPYFHVLQANQYYPTRKEFSEEERRVAFGGDDRYVESVKQGYPKLLSKLDGLRGSGINVINTVNVFDDVKEATYVDTCCHYNDLGNRLFSSFIAKSVADTLQEIRRADSTP